MNNFPELNVASRRLSHIPDWEWFVSVVPGPDCARGIQLKMISNARSMIEPWLKSTIGKRGELWKASMYNARIDIYFKDQSDATLFVLHFK